MSNDDKIIEIKQSEFEDMVRLIKELKRANRLLNEQIRKYNREFADKKDKE